MEQLLVLVIIVAAALVNILVRWARQRAQTPPRDSKPERPRPPERRERAGAAPVRAPAARPERAPWRPPLPTPTALVRRRRPGHRWLGRHADVRRGIIAMTILAPCRALEGDPRLPGG